MKRWIWWGQPNKGWKFHILSSGCGYGWPPVSESASHFPKVIRTGLRALGKLRPENPDEAGEASRPASQVQTIRKILQISNS